MPETVHDGALSADLLRCVNCGRVGDVMPSRNTTDDQPSTPRRCQSCRKADANPGKVHCEPCRKNWRAYMTHRKLRLDVKARGFKSVLADVTEKLLRIEAQRNFLLSNRKALGG